MNNAVMQRNGSAIESFRQELSRMNNEIMSALPSHIPVQHFCRVLQTAVNTSPELLNCNRKSFWQSAIKCATDGLLPDGREAAFVIFGNSVQYIPMYQGILKRIRNNNKNILISCHLIYENDYFVWEEGTNQQLIHKPLFPGDRGEIIGAYAVAHFVDNDSYQFVVMSKDEINAIRSASPSGRSDKSPWGKWWGEMAKKTVLRRLAKMLPMNADVMDLINKDVIEHTFTNEKETQQAITTESQTALSNDPLDALAEMDGDVIEDQPSIIDQLNACKTKDDYNRIEPEAQKEIQRLDKNEDFKQKDLLIETMQKVSARLHSAK